MSSGNWRPFCLGLNVVNWYVRKFNYRPLAKYVKLRVADAPRMPGTFPHHRLQRKPLVNDPGMHRGTCVTHVPWCMPGSLIHGGGENVPGIPGACATRNFTYLARGLWLMCFLLIHATLLLSSVARCLKWHKVSNFLSKSLKLQHSYAYHIIIQLIIKHEV